MRSRGKSTRFDLGDPTHRAINSSRQGRLVPADSAPCPRYPLPCAQFRPHHGLPSTLRRYPQPPEALSGKVTVRARAHPEKSPCYRFLYLDQGAPHARARAVFGAARLHVYATGRPRQAARCELGLSGRHPTRQWGGRLHGFRQPLWGEPRRSWPRFGLLRAGPETARIAASVRGHDHSPQSSSSPKPLRRPHAVRAPRVPHRAGNHGERGRSTGADTGTAPDRVTWSEAVHLRWVWDLNPR